MAKKLKEPKKLIPVQYLLGTDKPWRYPFIAENDVRDLVVKESIRRDNCNYSKIMNERLRQSYKQNPLKK